MEVSKIGEFRSVIMMVQAAPRAKFQTEMATSLALERYSNIDTEHRSISRDILLCSVPIRFTYSSAPLSTRFKCTATYYTIFFQADHINLARQDFFFFLRLATLILRPNFQSRFFSFHRNSWAVSDKERF